MLQWIVDEVMARGQGVEAVVRVIIIINFAAIHTSSSVRDFHFGVTQRTLTAETF